MRSGVSTNVESSLNAALRRSSGNVHAVAGDAREANLAGVAVRRDGHDLNGLARRLRRDDDRLCREVEGDAEHVGVFHVEAPVVVQVIGLPAQRAAHHLLA